MQAPPSLRNFISAFHGHWFEAMSGGVSVPFAILAVLLDNAYAKVILGLLAATAAGFAAYRAWAWEREKLIKKESELDDLKQRVERRLRIEFVPRRVHYETTAPKHAHGHAERTFRIRVINDGSESLPHCSVRLVSLIDKNGIDSRETNRRFKLMGDNPINITETGHKQEFVLSPGGEEFVEIVRLDEVNGEGKFDLLYAAEPKHRSIWASINKNTGPHDLTLVALGAPKPEYRKFRISVPLDGYLKFEDFGNPSALK